MSRIKTEELLDRIANGRFTSLRLNGMQSGPFCMLLEGVDGTFIHEDSNGNIKEYPKVDNALIWLKRMSGVSEVTVNIALWRSDQPVQQ
jgi:hypothetical protein